MSKANLPASDDCPKRIQLAQGLLIALPDDIQKQLRLSSRQSCEVTDLSTVSSLRAAYYFCRFGRRFSYHASISSQTPTAAIVKSLGSLPLQTTSPSLGAVFALSVQSLIRL